MHSCWGIVTLLCGCSDGCPLTAACLTEDDDTTTRIMLQNGQQGNLFKSKAQYTSAVLMMSS